MINLSRHDISAEPFTGRFLLVDDDKEHLAMLERYLSSMGYLFASAAEHGRVL